VFDIVMGNKTLDELMQAPSIFNRNSAVCCWYRLKIYFRESGNDEFWLGWGEGGPMDRLKLEQETTGTTGQKRFAPCPYGRTSHRRTGHSIPANIGTTILPPNTPENYVLPIEDVRRMIERDIVPKFVATTSPVLRSSLLEVI
jgi:hypothetical protein